MSIIIMSIGVVVEIALAIYCIATQSNQKKVRSWTRIGVFVAFVILLLTSVIEWSFRWKFLTTMLFAFAIIGSVSLVRNKPTVKKYGAVRVVLKTITLLFIVGIAVLPAVIFPEQRLPEVTGEYEVETAIYTYTDDHRIETFSKEAENRHVTVEFWYPKNVQDKYPLVIFSHGAMGVSASNTSSFNELASNGYVVCSVSHPYHSMITIDSKGKYTMVDKNFLKEVMDANNGIYDEETIYKITHKWLKLRTDDMDLVLNRIIEKSKHEKSEHVYSLIDISKIGLMGHSLGGAASAQLGRDRKDIKGVIDLDGGLIGEQLNYSQGQYVINEKKYPVPILFITTDTMKQAIERVTDPTIIIPQKLILETASEAYEVYFQGTDHFSVTDLPIFSPLLVKAISDSVNIDPAGQDVDEYYVIEKMNGIILKFFNDCLKDEGNFELPS